MEQVAQVTVGEALISLLEARGVDTVFGIPGVHTVELYRGLATSRIRHVTPRHEANAGFMADGYARTCGKPGVCFLITGPGVTNAITPMAQARADSVPMLVISGINPVDSHGLEEGLLHELPDQSATMASVAKLSLIVRRPEELERAIARAFQAMLTDRPGPVHIDIPTDVMGAPAAPGSGHPPSPIRPVAPHPDDISAAADALMRARQPVILAGGGTLECEVGLARVAEALDAPVITTVNARGHLAGHPLSVPASPSLRAVRALLAEADTVLALGTQFGPTDYDMYRDFGFPALAHLIRVDASQEQLTRGAVSYLGVHADAGLFLEALSQHLPDEAREASGKARAEATRAAALAELPEDYRDLVDVLERLREAVPGCRLVGDSTQLTYAGNLYFAPSAPGRWFNAATGYGALGFGPPAAIGAALAEPETPVLCLIGDGGLQFCLAELGTAMDEATPVIFLVWNNKGYREIESFMLENSIAPIGVDPSPPDFTRVAAAYRMPSERIVGTADLEAALQRAVTMGTPYLIEVLTS